MNIAVISDIHGNLAALDAVLAHAAGLNVSQMVNLGDLCSGALFPRETLARLMPLDLPTIRGNHERQLLTQSPEDMGLSDRHAATSLRTDQLAWLASLPDTLRLNDDILLVHGTPESDVAYLLETVTAEGLRAATSTEIQERIATVDASVILCGHTHLQRVVTLADGRMIVNPGSVGLPAFEDDRPYSHAVESGSPHARYATLFTDGNSWTVTLHAVEYDWEQAACDAAAHGRDDWARALRTGRT